MLRGSKPTWSLKSQDFRQIFEEQNPWSKTGSVPPVLAKTVERPLAKCLWSSLVADQPKRYQLILGPRRVGKTTAMYQTVRRLLQAGLGPHRLWWFRLDHPLLMHVPLGSLLQSLRESSGGTEEVSYVFLDELTYAKDWDLWLKTFYDDAWPFRIAGTSSSTAALRHRRTESGVGRWDEQYLTPYLFSEFLDLVGSPIHIEAADNLWNTLTACTHSPPDLSGLGDKRRKFILTGGFPELLIEDKGAQLDDASALLQSQRTLRNDAVERAIYKDIPQAFSVESPLLLERLLYTLAGRVTGIVSPNDICQTIGGLTQPTFDKYLSYLERAFLVFTLPNYSGNESSVQKRGRKLYFVDGAVRNAALQRGILPLSDSAEIGLLTENLAAGHLHALSQQSQVRVYHWRDGDNEVDLIYDHPEFPMAFEITTQGGHTRRGLYALMERYPKYDGRCFVVAENAAARMPQTNLDVIGTIPLDLFLLAVGAQADHDLRNRLCASAT